MFMLYLQVKLPLNPLKYIKDLKIVLFLLTLTGNAVMKFFI